MLHTRMHTGLLYSTTRTHTHATSGRLSSLCTGSAVPRCSSPSPHLRFCSRSRFRPVPSSPGSIIMHRAGRLIPLVMQHPLSPWNPISHPDTIYLPVRPSYAICSLQRVSVACARRQWCRRPCRMWPVVLPHRLLPQNRLLPDRL